MQKKALVIIDIQNDITKNYKDVIGNINKAIDWAVNNNIHVIYIRHENLSAGTRTLKPNTYGSELASDLKIVSNNVQTLLVKMKYVISTYQEQMLLLVLNQPVTTYAKQIMALMSYQIALPVMIKGKLMKC